MELNTLNRTLLFDTYGDMLTEKQRLYFDYRYNQDLALSEIGEIEGISRQAVHDNLIRCDTLLLEMEEKIGAVNRLLHREKAIDILSQALNVDTTDNTNIPLIQEYIKNAIDELKE